MAGCSSSSPARTTPSRASRWAAPASMRRKPWRVTSRALRPGAVAVLDQTAFAFPITNLSALPAGDYFAQALFDCNADLRFAEAPGNLYSKPQKIHFDPAQGGAWKLELTQQIPAEQLPAETEQIKFVKIQSKRLSEFYGRPIFLRAGIVLPRDYDARAVAALSALGAHRRLEQPLHGRPRPDGRELRVPQDLAGRRHAAPDPPATGRRRPQRRPLLRQLREQRPVRRCARRRNSSRTSRPRSAPSASRARASSPASPPAAGSAWRSRSSIPTSSTAPGPPAPTPWTSARSNWSTSTRTTTPT